MCESIAEGGRRCTKHHKKTIKEILEEAPSELEDHKPVNGALSIRVSETIARQTHDMPGPALAATINTPVEEEPFDVARYIQRSAARVDENRERLTVKRNVYIQGENLQALENEAGVLGLPVSTLAQMKVAGEDVYSHAPSMRKAAREDREVWMGIPLADREAVVAERIEADADVQAAEQEQALLTRVQITVAQGESAVTARRAELEAFIILRQGREGNYEAVGEAIRERKLLNLSLESIREEQKQAERAHQDALAKRQAAWDRALTLMQVAASVLPRRTRPFSNSFIMGFSTVARMKRGA